MGTGGDKRSELEGAEGAKAPTLAAPHCPTSLVRPVGPVGRLGRCLKGGSERI